jgi:hypothetical protein
MKLQFVCVKYILKSLYDSYNINTSDCFFEEIILTSDAILQNGMKISQIFLNLLVY